MVKVLALAPFILGLIAVACGGAASPTTGVTPGAQQAQEAAPVAGAFNADIKDFGHQDITIPVGTTVAWTNRDNVSHTTTEVSDTEIWDSFALQPGQSFSFTFTEAGAFNYFCTIHPTMRATVTVTGQQAPTMTPTREAVPTPEAASRATVAPPVAAAGANLAIVDFNHQDLTVAEGTTVTWTNAGEVIHTTTSNDGLWDSGVLESGQNFHFTFTQAGSFAFFCAIHPSMTATITVTGPPGAQAAPTAAAVPTSAPMPTPTATPATAPMPTAAATRRSIPKLQPTSTQAGPAPLTVDAVIVNFTHVDLTVPVGTTVVWTNNDPVQHTTTARDGDWDSDWLENSQSFSLTFPEPGAFSYLCTIHPSMTATVTVTPAEPAAVAPTPTLEPTPTLAPIPAPTAAAVILGFAHQDPDGAGRNDRGLDQPGPCRAHYYG